MYIVYDIQSCIHNYIYVGQTKDLEERLHRHNKGYEKTIKHYRPFILIYTEECVDRIEARKREKYCKTSAMMNYNLKIVCHFGRLFIF